MPPEVHPLAELKFAKPVHRVSAKTGPLGYCKTESCLEELPMLLISSLRTDGLGSMLLLETRYRESAPYPATAPELTDLRFQI